VATVSTERAIRRRRRRAPQKRTTGHERSKVAFAHPSEAEFARILDFYGVRWEYEPRSFPLRWEGDRIVEMFTPDFYLPELDLYIELTTLKQSLVTEKNRKLRHLRELHPEINVMLLYKRDYHRLLAKYGYGPLAHEDVRGIERVLITVDELERRITELGQQISQDYAGTEPVLIGVLKGVIPFMSDLMRHIALPLSVELMSVSYYTSDAEGVRITKDLDRDIAGCHVLMVEDIVDTGMTLNYLLHYLRTRRPASLKVCTLLDKRARRLVDLPLEYVGFEVSDEFVVGYGLDYLEKYRNLPFIGILKPEQDGRRPRRPSRRARGRRTGKKESPK
jgi:bifunctional protein TilS/HprT